MCGIVGVVSHSPVNQLIYDSLLLLQHRGQDAAGIATANGSNFHMHKANGMVRDVFRTRNMRSLPGNDRHWPSAVSDGRISIERGRSPAVLRERAVRHHPRPQRQPDELAAVEGRDVPDRSPPHQHRVGHGSPAQRASRTNCSCPAPAWNSIRPRCSSAVSGCASASEAVLMPIVSLIAGYGLAGLSATRSAFVRSCLGKHGNRGRALEWMVASESVAVEGIGFEFVRDVEPGEAIFIDNDGNLHNAAMRRRTRA